MHTQIVALGSLKKKISSSFIPNSRGKVSLVKTTRVAGVTFIRCQSPSCFRYCFTAPRGAHVQLLLFYIHIYRAKSLYTICGRANVCRLHIYTRRKFASVPELLNSKNKWISPRYFTIIRWRAYIYTSPKAKKKKKKRVIPCVLYIYLRVYICICMYKGAYHVWRRGISPSRQKTTERNRVFSK